ncbi:MAG: hypothetical protein KatS3mg129_0506 [Leptospiraceae bacterium]|nr:MAG: hypothetical protein KatS3mg129_0506 [Leptospiraceae bacterium]
MHLKNILSNLPLEIIHGKAVVEVRISGINKGNIINYFNNKKLHYDFMFFAGDDETDENLFSVLPEDAFSIKIGKGATHAKYRLNTVKELRFLLNKIYENLIND